MRAAMVPLAVGALLAAGVAAPAQAAPQAVGDVQLATVDSGGMLEHTIRHADGAWQSWGAVRFINGFASLVTSTVIDGVEHIFLRTQSGHPYQYGYEHIIRYTNGNWNIVGQPNGGIDPSAADGQAVADLNGHPALVRKQGNNLQLSIDQGDLTWSPWETVPVTGDIGSFSLSANGNTLRLAVSTPDGTKVGVSDRAADGTWSQPNWTPFNGGTATQIAVAQVGSDLEVAAVAHNGDRFEVWHSMLHSTGRWDQFGYVEGVAGDIPAVRQLAVTASNGAMQLVAGVQNGDLWHTIRYSNGSWQRFGRVQDVAGPLYAGQVTLAGQ